MKRNCLLALSALLGSAILTASGGVGASTPASLREMAKDILIPLPEKMPGAEKDTPVMIALGKKLFFDKRLSVNETISCNSCHMLDGQRAGVDNEPTSPGAFGKRGTRNSPTVLNAGFHATQFWDGRAKDLVEQAKGPVLNPVEMAMPTETEVIKRISGDDEYRKLFAQAFPDITDRISYQNVAHAIAAFERTLITRDRFDDFLKGEDQALSASALKGLELFLTAGCTACHNGPTLGGDTFQKVGLLHPYAHTNDVGRFEVTKNEDDLFKFKVPSLRNVALTKPYFHDGKVSALDAAVRQMAYMQLDRNLTAEETEFLVAFLNALSDKERTAKGQ